MEGFGPRCGRENQRFVSRAVDPLKGVGGFRFFMERVQTRTTTIYTETKINIKMPRNGLRMHLPRAKTT